MNEFKVGDVVRFRDWYIAEYRDSIIYPVPDEMLEDLSESKTGKILSIDKDEFEIELSNGAIWSFTEDMLVPPYAVEEGLTFEEFKYFLNQLVLVVRDKTKGGSALRRKIEHILSLQSSVAERENYLTAEIVGEIKRAKAKKKMTVEEIEKALGYEIEVVE